MKKLFAAIICLLGTVSFAFSQPVGANLGEPQDWGVDWPIADAGHIARGIGGGQGVVFWDRGPAMPDGDYIFEVHASASGSVGFGAGSTNFTLQPGESRTVTITDANAGNGVFISSGFGQPFSLWLPDSKDQLASDAWLKSAEDFSVMRWMDKQRTNGSGITTIADLPSMSGPWHSGYPLELIRDLSIASGTSPWICIPHRANDQLVAHIATVFADLPNVRYEYSNEVWNGGFPQHQQVGDMYGSGDQVWVRAWDGYGRRSTQIMEIIRSIDPDAIRVFGSQNDNPYVTEQILIAALAEGNGELLADEWSVAPYFAGSITQNRSAWEGQPFSAWVAEAHSDIDYVMGQAQLHADILAPYGVVLTAYEGGNHAAPLGADVNNSSWVQRTIDFGHLPEQFELHKHYMEAWGDLNNSGLFVYYMLAYHPTKFGSWGLTDQLDGTSPRREGFFAALSSPVDFNNDGFIDSGDISEFVALFLARDAAADMNGDGFLDNGDIGEFTRLFLEETGG